MYAIIQFLLIINSQFFLNDYKVFFITRDPRSNFCTLAKKSDFTRINNDTIDMFIEKYISSIKKIENMKKNFENIEIINYDKFVICDNLRDNLAHKLNLKKSNYIKYRYFNPAKSIYKVFNYVDYDENIIRYIESKCSSYCIKI